MAFSYLLPCLVLLLYLFPFCVGQVRSSESCTNRCGESYFRGHVCHCDYECLIHNECCKDYESSCTTSGSCKGRCGETFKRGRKCNCDPECIKYEQCCPDYKTHCVKESNDVSEPPNHSFTETTPTPISEGPEKPSLDEPHTEMERGADSGDVDKPSQISPPNMARDGAQDSSWRSVTETPPMETIASEKAAETGMETSVGDADTLSENDDVTIWTPTSPPATPVTQTQEQMETRALATALPKDVTVSLAVSSEQPSEPTKETSDKQTPASDNPTDYLADDSNDTNLCSGRAVSGLTTLRNGTVAVFRGHYFWILNAKRVPGPAQRITDVWGIPSPIDTVFTRCNCEGKTYFFKGHQYWRFENDVMDPGYPKNIAQGFGSLYGTITAALSVPAYRDRSESVFFFKRGGFVQKYTYKHGMSPTCGSAAKYMVFTPRRQARQADDGLGKQIKITRWGLPSLVTAAVSIPVKLKPDGYDYYIFSKTKYYNIRIDGEKPALASSPSAEEENSTKSWFKCP